MESERFQDYQPLYNSITSNATPQPSHFNSVSNFAEGLSSHLPEKNRYSVAHMFRADHINNLDYHQAYYHSGNSQSLNLDLSTSHVWFVWALTATILLFIVFGCSLRSRYFQENYLITRAKQWVHYPVLESRENIQEVEPGVMLITSGNDGAGCQLDITQDYVHHAEVSWISETNGYQEKGFAAQWCPSSLSLGNNFCIEDATNVSSPLPAQEMCPEVSAAHSADTDAEGIFTTKSEHAEGFLTKTGSLDDSRCCSQLHEKCLKTNKSVEEFLLPYSEATSGTPGATAGKCRKLQERRGSSHSLTIAVKPAENVLPTVTTPRECSPAQFLMTAGNCMPRSQLRACLKDVKSLHAEFWNIPTNAPEITEQTVCSALKNRYRYVLPNSHSRVKLPGDGSDPSSGYINGNYIRDYNGEPRIYIATQGPLDNTIDDFWLMVWSEKSPAIVMITRLVESGKAKCESYIPEPSGIYGSILVEVIGIEEQEGYTVRRLSLKNGDEIHYLHHFWYSDWPDHKTPDNPRALINMAVTVESLRQGNTLPPPLVSSHSDRVKNGTGPIVVHCSAGVGRTGCFIALCQGLNQLLKEGKVDVLAIVCAMRCDRGGLVQTAEQYEFIHRGLCLFESSLTESNGD